MSYEHSRNHAEIFKNNAYMSAVVLQGLLYYLRSTLTIDNRRWLAAHLVEPSEILEPYTSEELRTRIETAEADIAAGRYYSEEEMEDLMDKALAELKQSEVA